MQDKSIVFSLIVPVTLSSVSFNVLLKQRLGMELRETPSPAHNHGDFELRYIARGNTAVVMDGTTHELRTGEVFLIPPGVIHFQKPGASSNNLIQYILRFNLKQISESASGAKKKNFHDAVELLNGIKHLKDARTLTPIFERIDREITEKKHGYFNYLQALCTMLFLEIFRLPKQKNHNIFSADDAKHTGYWRLKLDHFFYRGYMNNIRLDDLAKEIRVSPRHASRLVQKEFGITYVAKLTEVRIEQAKYMLTYTERDLHAISAACGFSSYSYFTTCFKKNTGLTPTEFRIETSGKHANNK